MSFPMHPPETGVIVYCRVLLVATVLTRVLEIVIPEPDIAPVIFPEMMAGTQLNVVPVIADVRFNVKMVFEQIVADMGLLVTFGLTLTNRLTESALEHPEGLFTVTL